jgi:photosystem II stability/assembly factor-like uncharacterized protein
MTLRLPLLIALVLQILGGIRSSLPPQQAGTVNPSLFAELKWRPIGPMRGGRTRSAAGHPSHPYTFYIGVCNGGVWKTTDAGRTWVSIFDEQPTQSIGSLVVAPSDPSVIYVGSGEGLHRPDLSVGDGIYKSTDAGKTWTHLGLRDAQQIPNIAVDPKNPDRLFVAALGHPYGPNAERGIFRSMDGGRTFQPVLQKDENIGGNDVDIDPSNPNIVYANLWEDRQGPWENSTWSAAGGGIFKSTDGGTTWKQLTQGLPANVNQANLAIAPSNSRRIYAMVGTAGGGGGRAGGAPGGAGAAGAAAPAGRGGADAQASAPIYRSDDGGETWTAITTDNRPAGRIGGGDLPVPIVSPTNPDVVIMVSTVSWKSVDGGRTWAPFKGAPGGEDYQGAWINPDNPDIVLLVADQGGTVTLNGGETWSSWYNQPTAQLYHVAADNAFPYRVCSGQQESGSACVASRGNYGAISDRDWLPAGGDEYGYMAPDPLNPDIVFGGRSVVRFDRRTGQTSGAGPGGGRGGAAGGAGGPAARSPRTQPVVFSMADPHALYYGGALLWKTIDGGINWKQISPNFTRPQWEVPKSVGKYSDQPSAQARQLAAIYTIGPSYRDPNRIWIGTDDGMIHTTADGGLHWNDVTPPQMGSFYKVFMIDAGHFDALTAYAAGNTLRIDDMRPHLYRTHDGGKTWTEIVAGLGDAGPANTIREDPKKKGLLYASTEKSVYVSFDDGDHWQSLRLNLPASSVRDIIVKDDDVVAATHGRGFWILDNITPLRQIDAASLNAEAMLFRPSTAWRVRWNTSTDMPWPKEEATMPNPPEGTAIDYHLKSPASGPVLLEVLTSDGKLVRRYSSTDPVTPIPSASAAAVPLYWYRPPHGVSAAPGMHRFMWDVHYQPIGGGGGGGRGGLGIQAIPYNTGGGAGTPWVVPDTYTVKLTVNGKSYTQPITVKQDPRVKTPAVVMQQVYALTKASYFGAVDAAAATQRVQELRGQVATLMPKASGAVKQALAEFDKKAAELQGSAGAGAGAGRGGGGRGGRGGAPAEGAGPESLASIALAGVMNSLNAADVQPTANQLNAITSAQAVATRVLARWNLLKTVDLPALNLKLKAAGLDQIK